MGPVQPPSHRAFIALGSNVGDRVDMIEAACLEMDRVGVKVQRTSSLYETAPMYVLDQDPFLNGVCEVKIFSLPVACRSPPLTSPRLKPAWVRWNCWIRYRVLRSHLEGRS